MNEPVQIKQGYAKRETNRPGWKAEIRQLRCENKASCVATNFEIKAPYQLRFSNVRRWLRQGEETRSSARRDGNFVKLIVSANGSNIQKQFQ
jgi:hypothetical protein